MYRITYEQGNGYHCGCCRRTWERTKDCNTPEEVTRWLSELEASKKSSKLTWEDADDRRVVEIRKIEDEDLTYGFSADPKLVKKIIVKWKVNRAKDTMTYRNKFRAARSVKVKGGE